MLFLRPSEVVRRLGYEVRLQQLPELAQPLPDRAPCMFPEFRKRLHSEKTQTGAGGSSSSRVDFELQLRFGAAVLALVLAPRAVAILCSRFLESQEA